MEGNYGVYFGKEQVGKVQVLREGLYYRFVCRCRIASGILCRLHVVCGDRDENLGVVIPVGSGFGLDTRLPAKRLGQGMPEFRLHPKHGIPVETFIPISPEEPFAYLSRLKESYLVRKQGCSGIMVKEAAGTR